MPWTEEQLAEIYPEPDGYAFKHDRAFGGDCWFGPFSTLDELRAWADKHNVDGGIIPLYKTVDWRR